MGSEKIAVDNLSREMFGRRKEIFIGGGLAARSSAVSRVGQRFLINTVLPEASSPIQIVVNWTPN